MKLSILIEAPLDYFWGSEDELSKMTDEQLLELVEEDYTALLMNATFKVVRNKT